MVCKHRLDSLNCQRVLEERSSVSALASTSVPSALRGASVRPPEPLLSSKVMGQQDHSNQTSSAGWYLDIKPIHVRVSCLGDYTSGFHGKDSHRTCFQPNPRVN